MIRSSGVARLATHCYSQLIAAGKFSPRTNILNINIEREHIPHICSPFQHNEMELHKNLFFFHLICNQFSSLFYFGFFVYCFATKQKLCSVSRICIVCTLLKAHSIEFPIHRCFSSPKQVAAVQPKRWSIFVCFWKVLFIHGFSDLMQHVRNET